MKAGWGRERSRSGWGPREGSTELLEGSGPGLALQKIPELQPLAGSGVD